MKSRIILLALSSIVSILLVLFSGCYTQLGSLRNEKEGDEEYTTTEQQGDSSYTNENESEDYTYNSGSYDDYYRPHVGFSYYYPSSYWPSVAFGMAYADPWFYDYAWGYNSWNNYYSPVWNPYYGYYPYSYYSPYYPSYYNGYYYGYPGSSVLNGRRDVGEVRAQGREDNGNGRTYQLQGMPDVNLTTGAAIGKAPTSAPPPNRNSSTVKNNSRRSGSDRTYVPRDSRSAARSGNATHASGRSSSNRGDRRRDTQPQYRPNEPKNSSPPTYSTPPRENRGSTPSYTPPPAPPPSSNNGSSRSGSDRNSGESRGRRP